ncbi:hypothetical protein NE235_10580 [Actinoallomurus spadix]|uniref:HTH cro/C1-type domain-containing protein n=1 Tax=Actinoallomurus spadix TaxID=79912 RepID=A0ABP3GKS2_9ACTN|nr:hypothetical protein [Actinoallomurus spadix]MCO5986547.1 hypothetical protein [Actinoallomurus spadix]
MEKVAIGAAVEARYKQLGLTQDTLAFLAGVSNSTIRNVLHSRVNVARTWPRVERALGWVHGSLSALRDGDAPEEVLPLEALKSLQSAILRKAAAADDDEAMDIAAGLYEELVNALQRFSTGNGSGYEVRELIDDAWDALNEYLSPAEAEPLLDGFRDFAWRGPSVNIRASLQSAASAKGSLHRSTSVDLSGPAMQEADILESPHARVSQVAFTAPSPAASRADNDELVAEIGDGEVSLWRIGGGVKLGLAKLNMGIPVSSEALRLLTKDDLWVIANAIEAQVTVLARSLTAAHSNAEALQSPTQGTLFSEEQIQELKDELNHAWERQLLLVHQLHDQGADISKIASLIGMGERDVWEMLKMLPVTSSRRSDEDESDSDQGD